MSGTNDNGCDAEPDVHALKADPFVGTRLGSYVLFEQIGSGGMCAIYRARHIDFGTEFAVKVLHPGRAPQEVFTHRLRREAAAGLRLNHPNVVKVIELGMGSHGPYLVMELLIGRTLHEVLRDDGPIAPLLAAKIVRQIADGLSAAHRAGFVHRDLKPGNIMLSPTELGEEVKILDLGIVGVTGGDPREQLTRDNLVVGTPAYMAPEQFHGSSSVGPQADLYALGVVLYQLLRGRAPFDGTFQEIIAQHMMTPPDPLGDSEGLEELAYWLLEKNPAKRPQSAADVIAFIDRHFPNCAGASLGDDPKRAIDPERERQAPIVALSDADEPLNLVPVSDAARVPLPDPKTRLQAPPIPGPPLSPSLIAERRRMLGSRSTRTSRRFRLGSRFKPARRLRWPLRLAIPLVWSVALVGASYAAQRILRAHEPMVAPVVEQAPVEPGPKAAADRTDGAEEKREVALAKIERTFDRKVVTGPAIAPTAQAPILDRAPKAAGARALDKKLHRVTQLLDGLGKKKKIAPAELAAFEDWYLDLAEDARPGLGDADAKLLAGRVDMLLSRINRIAKQHH
jgi:serine/threonine-protein kinase